MNEAIARTLVLAQAVRQAIVSAPQHFLHGLQSAWDALPGPFWVKGSIILSVVLVVIDPMLWLVTASAVVSGSFIVLIALRSSEQEACRDREYRRSLTQLRKVAGMYSWRVAVLEQPDHSQCVQVFAETGHLLAQGFGYDIYDAAAVALTNASRARWASAS